MIELKFLAENKDGRSLNGTFTAVNFREGKKKIYNLAERNNLKIKKIEKKSTYLYKIQKDNDKPIKGDQKAFSKLEVKNALTKLGFKVLSVNKKLFDFSFNPPPSEIVSFVKISAELLEQKLPYS